MGNKNSAASRHVGHHTPSPFDSYEVLKENSNLIIRPHTSVRLVDYKFASCEAGRALNDLFERWSAVGLHQRDELNKYAKLFTECFVNTHSDLYWMMEWKSEQDMEELLKIEKLAANYKSDSTQVNNHVMRFLVPPIKPLRQAEAPGHPAVVLKALVKELRMSLPMFNNQSNEDYKPSSFRNIHIFEALAIAVRSKHNVLIMHYESLFAVVVEHLSLIESWFKNVKYITTASNSILSSIDADANIYNEIIQSMNILRHISHIISALTDRGGVAAGRSDWKQSALDAINPNHKFAKPMHTFNSLCECVHHSSGNKPIDDSMLLKSQYALSISSCGDQVGEYWADFLPLLLNCLRYFILSSSIKFIYNSNYDNKCSCNETEDHSMLHYSKLRLVTDYLCAINAIVDCIGSVLSHGPSKTRKWFRDNDGAQLLIRQLSYPETFINEIKVKCDSCSDEDLDNLIYAYSIQRILAIHCLRETLKDFDSKVESSLIYDSCIALLNSKVVPSISSNHSHTGSYSNISMENLDTSGIGFDSVEHYNYSFLDKNEKLNSNSLSNLSECLLWLSTSVIAPYSADTSVFKCPLFLSMLDCTSEMGVSHTTYETIVWLQQWRKHVYDPLLQDTAERFKPKRRQRSRSRSIDSTSSFHERDPILCCLIVPNSYHPFTGPFNDSEVDNSEHGGNSAHKPFKFGNYGFLINEALDSSMSSIEEVDHILTSPGLELFGDAVLSLFLNSNSTNNTICLIQPIIASFVNIFSIDEESQPHVQRAKKHLKSRVPTLQLWILRMVEFLFSYSSNTELSSSNEMIIMVIRACRSLKFWDVLFSDYFYWGSNGIISNCVYISSAPTLPNASKMESKEPHINEVLYGDKLYNVCFHSNQIDEEREIVVESEDDFSSASSNSEIKVRKDSVVNTSRFSDLQVAKSFLFVRERVLHLMEAATLKVAEITMFKLNKESLLIDGYAIEMQTLLYVLILAQNNYDDATVIQISKCCCTLLNTTPIVRKIFEESYALKVLIPIISKSHNNLKIYTLTNNKSNKNFTISPAKAKSEMQKRKSKSKSVLPKTGAKKKNLTINTKEDREELNLPLSWYLDNDYFCSDIKKSPFINNIIINNTKVNKVNPYPLMISPTKVNPTITPRSQHKNYRKMDYDTSNLNSKPIDEYISIPLAAHHSLLNVLELFIHGSSKFKSNKLNSDLTYYIQCKILSTKECFLSDTISSSSISTKSVLINSPCRGIQYENNHHTLSNDTNNLSLIDLLSSLVIEGNGRTERIGMSICSALINLTVPNDSNKHSTLTKDVIESQRCLCTSFVSLLPIVSQRTYNSIYLYNNYQLFSENLLLQLKNKATLDLLYVLRWCMKPAVDVNNVVVYNNRMQQLFCDCGLILQLMSLLNIDPDQRTTEYHNTLAHDVLKTLLSVMADNDTVKSFFHDMIEYDKLCALVLRASNNSPGIELICTIFDMMFDSSGRVTVNYDGFKDKYEFKLNSESNALFKNPDVVHFLFSLLPSCKLNIQLSVVEFFHTLIDDDGSNGAVANINASMCVEVNPPLITLILDMFPSLVFDFQKALISIIKSLGSCTISVRELKSMFRLFHTTNTSDGNETLALRSPHVSSLLDALHFMLRERDGPACYFFFDGLQSGLQLQLSSLPLSQATKGYSFHTWIRVENFNKVTPSSSEEETIFESSYLFSIISESGHGIELRLMPVMENEAVLANVEMVLHTGLRNSPVVLKTACQLNIQQWYCFGVTHSNVSLLGWNSAEVRIYINGSQVGDAYSLNYPHFNKNSLLKWCFVGCRSPRIGLDDFQAKEMSNPKSKQDKTSIIETSNCLHGQLGTIYLFDDCLTANRMNALFKLGADYIYCFDSFESILNILSKSIRHALLKDPPLSKCVLLSYNAQVSLNGYFLNNASRFKNLSDKNPAYIYDALKLNGTYSVIRKGARGIMNAVGGIKSLFPLLAQYDLPSYRDDMKVINYDCDPSLNVSLLKFFITLLNHRNNAFTQKFILASDGFSLLAHLLRRVSPLHMTVEAFDILLHLAINMSFSNIMLERVIKELIFNPILWLFCPIDIQLHRFNAIQNLGNYITGSQGTTTSSSSQKEQMPSSSPLSASPLSSVYEKEQSKEPNVPEMKNFNSIFLRRYIGIESALDSLRIFFATSIPNIYNMKRKASEEEMGDDVEYTVSRHSRVGTDAAFISDCEDGSPEDGYDSRKKSSSSLIHNDEVIVEPEFISYDVELDFAKNSTNDTHKTYVLKGCLLTKMPLSIVKPLEQWTLSKEIAQGIVEREHVAGLMNQNSNVYNKCHRLDLNEVEAINEAHLNFIMTMLSDSSRKIENDDDDSFTVLKKHEAITMAHFLVTADHALQIIGILRILIKLFKDKTNGTASLFVFVRSINSKNMLKSHYLHKDDGSNHNTHRNGADNDSETTSKNSTKPKRSKSFGIIELLLMLIRINDVNIIVMCIEILGLVFSKTLNQFIDVSNSKKSKQQMLATYKVNLLPTEIGFVKKYTVPNQKLKLWTYIGRQLTCTCSSSCKASNVSLIISSLLDAAISETSLTQTIMSAPSTLENNSKILSNPEALSTIFMLLSNSSITVLQRNHVLYQLCELFEKNASNCMIMLQLPEWQRMLFGLLVISGDEQCIIEPIMNVFQKVHIYSLLNYEACYQVIQPKIEEEASNLSYLSVIQNTIMILNLYFRQDLHVSSIISILLTDILKYFLSTSQSWMDLFNVKLADEKVKRLELICKVAYLVEEHNENTGDAVAAVAAVDDDNDENTAKVDEDVAASSEVKDDFEKADKELLKEILYNNGDDYEDTKLLVSTYEIKYGPPSDHNTTSDHLKSERKDSFSANVTININKNFSNCCHPVLPFKKIKLSVANADVNWKFASYELLMNLLDCCITCINNLIASFGVHGKNCKKLPKNERKRILALIYNCEELKMKIIHILLRTLLQSIQSTCFLDASVFEARINLDDRMKEEGSITVGLKNMRFDEDDYLIPTVLWLLLYRLNTLINSNTFLKILNSDKGEIAKWVEASLIQSLISVRNKRPWNSVFNAYVKNILVCCINVNNLSHRKWINDLYIENSTLNEDKNIVEPKQPAEDYDTTLYISDEAHQNDMLTIVGCVDNNISSTNIDYWFVITSGVNTLLTMLNQKRNAMNIRLKNRRQKMCLKIHKHYAQLIDEYLHAAIQWYDNTDGMIWTMSNAEEFRLEYKGHELREGDRRATRNWRRLLREVTTERSAWGSLKLSSQALQLRSSPDEEYGLKLAFDDSDSNANTSERIYWKLDPSETSSRCRLKLKLNFHGTNHELASARMRGNKFNIKTSNIRHHSSQHSSLPGLFRELKLARALGVGFRPSTSLGIEQKAAKLAKLENGGNNAPNSMYSNDSAASKHRNSIDATGYSYDNNHISNSELGPYDPLVFENEDPIKVENSFMDPEIDPLAGYESNPFLLDDAIKVIKNDNNQKHEADDHLDDGLMVETSSSKKSKSVNVNSSNFKREKHIYNVRCELVTAMLVTSGIFEITDKCIRFLRDDDNGDSDDDDDGVVRGTGKEKRRGLLQPPRSRQWALRHTRSVELRRFQMQWVALEIFFDSPESNAFFFNFHTPNQRRKVHLMLRSVDARLGKSMETVQSSIGYAYDLFGNFVNPSENKINASGHPMQILRNSGLTKLWVDRKISNFDYLMRLNEIAGRTYNDLAQYPIFPWVIADYKSATLDLCNQDIYRDLSKPIGAQNPRRQEELMMKYKSMADDYYRMVQSEEAEHFDESQVLQGPPWHYGSHYSSRGIVLWYLLRLEPFTSMHIHLQDGKFDHPDRQFVSIENAFYFATNVSVREIIPEFFSSPEFLINSSNFDLGERQNGKKVDHVELPPWARNAEDFIRINRQALESEYVSNNLHKWIDLIFGCKQRGPQLRHGSQQAVDACNVFFHLTYEGAVDLNRLREVRPILYDTVTKMIDEYGQVPPQLLERPHPARKKLEEVVFPMFSTMLPSVLGYATTVPPLSRPMEIVLHKPYKICYTPLLKDKEKEKNVEENDMDMAILFIAEAGGQISNSNLIPAMSRDRLTLNYSQPYVPKDWVVANRLVTVNRNRILGIHKWTVRDPDIALSFELEVDKRLQIYKNKNILKSNRSKNKNLPPPIEIGINFASLLNQKNQDSKRLRDNTNKNPHLGSHMFAVSYNGRYIFSCGYWDNSFKVSEIETGKTVQSIIQHQDVVTSLALSKDGRRLVTGSRDACVIVWKIFNQATGKNQSEENVLSEQISAKSPSNTSSQPSSTLKYGKHLFLFKRKAKEPPNKKASNVLNRINLINGPVTSLCHILVGHDDAVTCVALNRDLDIVVSASFDGTCLIHTLKHGEYVRSIYPGWQQIGATWRPCVSSEDNYINTTVENISKSCIDFVGVSSTSGLIVTYSAIDLMLYVYSINGKMIAQRDVPGHLYAFDLSYDGEYLITGGVRCQIMVYDLCTLAVMTRQYGSEHKGYQLPALPSPITSIRLTQRPPMSPPEQQLLVGTQDGELFIFTLDARYLRQRLHQKLSGLGF